MKNSWTAVLLTILLVTWLGFASISNKKVEPQDNVRSLSGSTLRVHPELRRANTNVALVDRIDGFGKNKIPRANFANCPEGDCCCLVGSDAKCATPDDCSAASGHCVDDSKCVTGARSEEVR